MDHQEVKALTLPKADLLDITQLNNLLKEEDFDIVINSAGNPSPDFCESKPRKALELNTLTSINLIKSLKKLKKETVLNKYFYDLCIRRHRVAKQ